MALAPAKEGKGDIIIVTNSGGKNALFVASFLAELNTTSWLARAGDLQRPVPDIPRERGAAEGERGLGPGEVSPQEVSRVDLLMVV